MIVTFIINSSVRLKCFASLVLLKTDKILVSGHYKAIWCHYGLKHLKCKVHLIQNAQMKVQLVLISSVKQLWHRLNSKQYNIILL